MAENSQQQVQQNIRVLYSCEICGKEEIPAEKMFSLTCGHAFCLDCWRASFKTHVNQSQEFFQCMQDGCEMVVEMQHVMEYNLHNGDDKVMQRYSTSCNLLRGKDNIKVCPKCHTNTTVESQGFKVVCSSCGYTYCKVCLNDYHEGITCEEYQTFKLAKMEAENEKILSTCEMKPCPNPSCHTPILKNGGCQWMQCAKCKTYFCWICMQETNDHAHKPGQQCHPHGELV